MPRPASLSDQMRNIIRKCKSSQYEISKKTGIAESTLSRFMSKQRSLSPAAWDALGKYFCLELQDSHWTPTAEERLQEDLYEACKKMTGTKPKKKRSKKST